MKKTKKKHSATTKSPSAKKRSCLSKYYQALIIGLAACCVGILVTQLNFTADPAIVSSAFTKRTNFNISCSNDYKDLDVFEQCTPLKTCGRIVTDSVVSQDEASKLLNLAKRGFSHGGSNGGASILDLHSGALSMGDKFVNIYAYLDNEVLRNTFNTEDFKFYSTVKNKVHSTIASEFGIDGTKLYLTHPTFFSRITNTSAKTEHDEYWHKHIDKIQYGSFDYTSLLYLSDYGIDFMGGRFIFDDQNNIHVEPRKGRLSFFTSGSENPHHVEKVVTGVRYAITISFTCDPKKAIEDPSMREM